MFQNVLINVFCVTRMNFLITLLAPYIVSLYQIYSILASLFPPYTEIYLMFLPNLIDIFGQMLIYFPKNNYKIPLKRR